MAMLLSIHCLLLIQLFVGVLCLFLALYTLLYVLLVLQSPWWGGERWLLLYFNCLTDVLWLLVMCGSFSGCHGLVCSVWCGISWSYPLAFLSFILLLIKLISMCFVYVNTRRYHKAIIAKEWVWSGNTTIIYCRLTHGTVSKSHRTFIVTIHL